MPKRRGPTPKVEIDFVMLADTAEVVNQKLYMLGGAWNVVWAKAYPANHPMAIAVGILVPWALTDEDHTVTVELKDQDENPIAPILTAQAKVGRPVNLKPGTAQRLMFVVQGIFGIPRAGSYVVRATVGDVSRSASFDAVMSAAS